MELDLIIKKEKEKEKKEKSRSQFLSYFCRSLNII